MATAREIALEILPHFAENVLARQVFSYGVYAYAVGRDVANGSIAMGPAMHAIGAVCVFARIPVAPLYFVKRSNSQSAQVFTNDPLESQRVLQHYSTLFVAAREYHYSRRDFERLESALRKIPKDWSPHLMWHVAIATNPSGYDETFFQRALVVYKEIIGNARKSRRG
jgi:hypothetical protein